MATYTANIATTQTLSANTVDTVTLTSPATRVTVTCSSAVGAGTVYFTVGSGSATTPTVGGSNAYAVVAGSSFTVDFDGSFPTVKLISSAALTYTVAAASVFNKLADNTVDNSTLQLSSGIVSVKDGGIGTSKLDSTVNTYLTNSGLVYVTQQSIGTGATSVTVSNCFSSTYDSYRVVIANGNGSAASNLQFQFQGRTTNYYCSMYYDFHTGGDTGTVRRSNGAHLLVGQSAGLGYYNSDFNVSGVNNGRPNLSGTYYGNGYAGWFGGVCDTGGSITVTGLTLSPSAGTFTGGTITVYGYRKA